MGERCMFRILSGASLSTTACSRRINHWMYVSLASFSPMTLGRPYTPMGNVWMCLCIYVYTLYVSVSQTNGREGGIARSCGLRGYWFDQRLFYMQPKLSILCLPSMLVLSRQTCYIFLDTGVGMYEILSVPAYRPIWKSAFQLCGQNWMNKVLPIRLIILLRTSTNTVELRCYRKLQQTSAAASLQTTMQHGYGPPHNKIPHMYTPQGHRYGPPHNKTPHLYTPHWHMRLIVYTSAKSTFEHWRGLRAVGHRSQDSWNLFGIGLGADCNCCQRQLNTITLFDWVSTSTILTCTARLGSVSASQSSAYHD